MMMQSLCTPEEARERIEHGAALLLAGDESLLRQLPPGRWIGGTIPYFLGREGGTFSKDRLFVNEVPAVVESLRITAYDKESLGRVYSDAPDNGFSFIIIPGMSEAHLSFALNAPAYPGFGAAPLIGWIAGVDLAELGRVSPKVVDGTSGVLLGDRAVVMHVTLSSDKSAEPGIVNIFEQGNGDTLRFPSTGFKVTDVLLGDRRVNFAHYIAEKNADSKLPLVADYCGAMINTSLQEVNVDTGEVVLYAPVFEGVEYRWAAPVNDYVKAFTSRVPSTSQDTVVFSCNCILNYLYSELEGKRTGPFVGPVTFGEIAYQLLNQTLVYLRIVDGPDQWA
jgi:hypothetical protein